MMALFDRRRPLITILLLCYNHESFVAEAVGGVLSQTYSPLEIFIFDDCSTDRTAEVIERALAGQPPRPNVRFIRNTKNIGARAVGKIGLDMAKGAYIFFSCGDDVMLPNMVEEMANVLISEDVSLVTANAHYIDNNSKPLNRTFRDPGQPADDSFESLVRDGANACCFGPVMGFERAIYERFGWVPDSVKGYDIIYPFYAYLLNGARFVNTPLLKYRVHEQNTSLSLSAERAESLEKYAIEESIYLNHLAHGVLMEEILDRLRGEMPERYGQIAKRLLPLVTIQLAEVSKKLVRSRRTHIKY
jgi:glycosyltransferase involved in cell wall biosynthesis